MKQPLAIIGASTRSAAASAVRAGFQPLAADLFADVDLRRIATTTRITPYPEGFIDWLRTVEPPAWMYTGALENHPDLVDQMAWIAPLLGNPGDVLQRVRSPFELSGALKGAGFLFPEIRTSADGLPRDGSWLVKTYQGASGSGVRSFKIPLPFRAGQGEVSAAVFQRHVTGTPCAAVYIASDGNAFLLGLTRQIIGEDWVGSHGFQYAGSIGPWPVSDAARTTLGNLGNALAAEFELVGLFGVDFILNGNEVWTLEVNPRYTASVEIVERFSGVSAIAAHVSACAGFSVTEERAGPSAAPIGGEDAPAREQCHGKAILFARRDLEMSRPFADFALAEATRTPWPALADVSATETLIESGRPILTLFAEGSTVEAVEEQLRRRVVDLEKKLYNL